MNSEAAGCDGDRKQLEFLNDEGNRNETKGKQGQVGQYVRCVDYRTNAIPDQPTE